ncbi:MAG: tyrosine-type recombinase/integrase [Acidobacteria bacterium]|nr:tyrosine-type recombinase/integrase [Acidobacteriota bacterium]
MTPSLGALLHAFLVDELPLQKGFRPASTRAYRDGLRLFLTFVAADRSCRLTQLTPEDMTAERVQRFLLHLEQERHNHRRTRNHRLAILRTFFDFLARRCPERLAAAQRVAAIAVKRTPPAETHFLEREEVARLFRRLPSDGPFALRDRALLLLLYNTGARVQEIADLRVAHLDLQGQPGVRLHGKGDKWRSCPLWTQTAQLLRDMLQTRRPQPSAMMPVFVSRGERALTRFGIYKIVRRHTRHLDVRRPATGRHISPHVFRHTAAVHLLEAGVDVNVIRAWLGHVRLDTTNRYAEITTRTKLAALQLCEPDATPTDSPRRNAVWRDDQALLSWLASL